MIDTTRDHAGRQDLGDPLASFRNRFHLPDGIYMDGNSLGLMSKDAEQSLLCAMDEWKRLGIGGWLDSTPQWHFYGETLGEMVSQMVGADPSEVCMACSTTVNMHNLVATFYHPRGKRTKIVADELNFPSTLYALQSQVRLHGLDPQEHLVMVGSRDGLTLCEEDIIAAMDETIAVAVLPAVLYRSGQLLNLRRLAEEAHSRGIIIGFDCAHSAGSVAHRLDEDDVDFATWCSYKHFNGGPGAPAFLFINKRHFSKQPGLAGWYGFVREKQFDMDPWFKHAQQAGGWQIGTPHVLSAAPLFGALKMFREAGIERIRAKSLRLTRYFMEQAEERLIKTGYGFALGTPQEEERRGGHAALLHEEAWRICRALKAHGVIPDYRPPNVIRIAPVALYNTFDEVWAVVDTLEKIIIEREYEQFSTQRDTVS